MCNPIKEMVYGILKIKFNERMNQMKKQIKVRAIEGFTVHNFDESQLLGEVEEGQEFVADLYEDTEEYFTKDMRGREIYVGELDATGKLQLDDCFIQI